MSIVLPSFWAPRARAIRPPSGQFQHPQVALPLGFAGVLPTVAVRFRGQGRGTVQAEIAA